MGLRINHNSSAIAAQTLLRRTDSSMTATLARLSSGIRIQQASDDPAGLAIANTMRHHLQGLDQATSNIEDGVALIQTAEGAMDQVNSMLNKARTLAIAAANEGVNNPEQVEAYQAELDEIIDSILAVSERTVFGSKTLLDGSQAQNTLTAASKTDYSSITQDYQLLPGGIQENSTLSWSVPDGALARATITANFGAATPATQTIAGATQNGVTLDDASTRTVTVTGPKGTASFTLQATTTINDVVALINGNSTITGARASYDSVTGDLVVDSEHFGGGTLNISSDDMTTGGTTVGLLDSDTNSVANSFLVGAANRNMTMTYTAEDGTSHTINMIQDPSTNDGLSFISTDNGPETDRPYSAYLAGAFRVTLRDTTDGSVGSTLTAPTSGGTATRLSSLTIQTGALSGQATAIDLPDLKPNAIGRVQAHFGDGYTSLQSLKDRQALIVGDANTALEIVDAAINEVALARGKAGAVQTNLLETGLDSLRVSIENLTDAESRIRDTDFALESAEFARLNITMQAATSMLAQANQVPQSVLQLLQ